MGNNWNRHSYAYNEKKNISTKTATSTNSKACQTSGVDKEVSGMAAQSRKAIEQQGTTVFHSTLII